MKLLVVLAFLASSLSFADTPPPGTVKAKLWSGDGNTSFNATGNSLDVNVTNASGLTTVNQGNAGLQSWLVDVTSSALPANACKETGGNLAAILAALQGTIQIAGPVVVASPLPAGTNTIGAVNVNGTIPISGSITANQGTPGPTASPWPVVVPSPVAVTGTFWQATQPVSAAGLPLPSGASTEAKQPALGTAGTASSDVLTVQGIASMTALKVDGSGVTQPISGTVTANAGTGTFTVDGSGHTQPVSGTFWQATQPVSGTVTANVGTTNGLALDTTVSGLQVAQGSTTASQNGGLIQAAVTTAAPSYTTGKTDPLSLTTGGLLRVDASGTSITGTVTANAGTGTFTVDGSGHTQPVSGTFWQATQPVSGTVTANAGTGTFTVDGSGHTQPVSGTVTANIGTSGSLALDASVTGLQVAQGSTTSGQSGGLLQGAVTTAAPTYTTGKTNPFSLTTTGGLRVDGSGSTQPVSGTVTANAGTGTFTVDGSGHTQPVSLTTLPALTTGSAVIGKVSIDQTTPGTTNLVALAANQSVNVAQINAATPLMGNGVTGTGSQRVTIASDNTAFTVNAAPKTPSALTVKQAAITVGTSAVRLTNDGSAPPSTRVLLVAQLLSTSTANCFFGSSGVTTSSTTRGVQMFAGQTFSWSLDAGDYYAICDAATQTILITEQE